MLPHRPSRQGTEGGPTRSEIAQPDDRTRDVSREGDVRCISRIDRACVSISMAEARVFRCQSGIVDNLSDATLPSDHIPVRVTMEKQTHRPQITTHVRLWMTKHSTFNPTLTRLDESCRYGCSATVQRHGDNCEGAHSRGYLEKMNSRNTRWEIVDRQYCSSRIQESPPHHALRCWETWEPVKRWC